MAKVNLVGWFEIYVDDIARAVKFYEGVFQLKLDKLEDTGDFMKGLEMHMFPSDHEKYGSPGAICRMDGVKAGCNSVMVYFTCDDCAVEASRVEDNGGKLVSDKFQIGEYGYISIASDTEGNMIGLHSLQ